MALLITSAATEDSETMQKRTLDGQVVCFEPCMLDLPRYLRIQQLPQYRHLSAASSISVCQLLWP